MNEMVEKIARSLAFVAGSKICGPGQHVASRELGWKGDGGHMDEYVEQHWREHVTAALFAIEAMRVPTESMLFVGSEEAGCTQLDLRHSWGSMIHEALK